MGTAPDRRGRLAAVLLLAVLGTGCATTIPGTPTAAPIAVSASSDSSAYPAPTATRRPTAPPTPPASRAPAPAPVSGPLVLEPVVPGWNVVRSTKRDAAYDVPPTWNVKSEDTVIGFKDRNGNPLVSTGAATFGEGVCGEYGSLALAVVRHDEGLDPVAAARNNAQVWADSAYLDAADTPPVLVTGPAEPFVTAAGQQASITKVTATTATPTGTCGITVGSVYAVAATGFAGELGPTVVLVVVADEAVTGAVAEAEIRQVLSTLRPVS